MHDVRSLISNKAITVAAAVLLAQVCVFYVLAGQEKALPDATLESVPNQFNQWRQVGEEQPLDQEILDLLKADRVLNRQYVDGSGQTVASLFVAFFKTQRAGVSPHSPKVCLPGSGWTPRESAIISLNVPSFDSPVPINRYIVSKGEARSVVLYWYQSFNRVVADEYAAKLYLMMDAVRHRRSDTAMVRVVIPVRDGQTEEQAQRAGEAFIKDFFQPLRTHLPG